MRPAPGSSRPDVAGGVGLPGDALHGGGGQPADAGGAADDDEPAPMPAAKYAMTLGFILGFLLSVSCHSKIKCAGLRVHADEDGGEQREDVGLDEGDQHLEEQEMKSGADRDRCQAAPPTADLAHQGR